MEWTLVVAALASFAAGAVFLRMGWRLRHKARSPSGRPLAPFSVWWLAMGAATIAYGLRLLAADAGRDIAVVALFAAGIAVSGVAIWGLVAYLSYVYTGSSKGGRVAAWFYGLLIPATLAFIAWAAPHRIEVKAWTVEVASVAAPLGPGMDILLTLAFLVPPIVAGIMILRLLPRSRGRAQRRRILAVGIGIPIWVSVHVVARISEADAWQFFARVVLGVAVAFTIALAYGVGPRPRGDADGIQERVLALV